MIIFSLCGFIKSQHEMWDPLWTTWIGWSVFPALICTARHWPSRALYAELAIKHDCWEIVENCGSLVPIMSNCSVLFLSQERSYTPVAPGIEMAGITPRVFGVHRPLLTTRQPRDPATREGSWHVLYGWYHCFKQVHYCRNPAVKLVLPPVLTSSDYLDLTNVNGKALDLSKFEWMPSQMSGKSVGPNIHIRRLLVLVSLSLYV